VAQALLEAAQALLMEQQQLLLAIRGPS